MIADWTAPERARLKGETVRMALLFRMETDPVERVWSGIGDFTIPPDLIEPSGATYSGIGQMISVPSFQQLINGQAERLEFEIASVSQEIVALARSEAITVQGAPVQLGFCVLDEGLQQITPTAWIWDGVADVVTPKAQGDIRTITLSVGSLFTGRRRGSLSYWTDAQQQQRSPGDKACSNVAGYTAETTKRFRARTG